ncbi:nucleotidyltransferase family protein [Lentibacillus salinarum]|uniref:Nucleotidyltransferase family protein n=1 Tax=Lentibacillus salinarum TaxID=446820 RepID=A0ABW3ZZ26_9BACI
MSIYTTLKDNREKILISAREHGIQNLKLFGSAARMEDQEDSDVDFLVTFEDDRSLFDLIRFKNDVEDILHRDVDVVTENAVHHSIRVKILSEARPL